MTPRDHITAIVGSVLMLALQVAVAPHIAVGSALPNFVAVFVMVLAVTRASGYGCVLPFVMGLLFDLVSGGPLGPMAFSLLLFSYISSRIFAHVDNDTLFMPALTLAVALLLVEVSYGIFMLLLGYDAGLLQALVYRAVPCYLYDCVVALVLYPLVRRLLPAAEPLVGDIFQLR